MSLCMGKWDYCFAGDKHNRDPETVRVIPELPCWGKCKGPSSMFSGCPNGYEKDTKRKRLQDNCGKTASFKPKQESRRLCSKTDLDWRANNIKYVGKGGEDVSYKEPGCKNKKCASGEIFLQDEWCRTAANGVCPGGGLIAEEKKGICRASDEHLDPGEFPASYESVNFCKTSIHFQHYKNKYKGIYYLYIKFTVFRNIYIYNI